MRLAYGTLLLTTAALTLAVGATRAAAQTGTVPSDLRAGFKAADKNGDGRLDREEFRQAAMERFYFRDEEHKGYLNRRSIAGSQSGGVQGRQRQA